MTDNGHERWSDEVAAYLLGALEPGEVDELERHLAGCESCRAELRRLEPAAWVLPETVTRVEPPPRLRKQLLAEVREDARRSGTAGAGERQGFAAWWRRLRARPLALRLSAGLAAVVLVAAVVVGYEVGSGGGSGGGSSRFVSHQGGLTATVVREGDAGALRLANVKPLPPDRVLEAWVRRDGRVEPVRALFVPDRAGRAATVLGDMRGVDTVMVTTEPPGGSQSPTSAPIATVAISPQ